MKREEDGLYADGGARTTVSFRQPAHVIKFPDDDEEEDDNGAAFRLLRQAGRKTSIRGDDFVVVVVVVVVAGAARAASRHLDAHARVSVSAKEEVEVDRFFSSMGGGGGQDGSLKIASAFENEESVIV